MDSFITGIQDFISNPLGTPVGQLLEKASNSEEASENWALYMEICDIINETEEGAKDAARALRKLLVNYVGKNNVATLYTLTILETCVKNCGIRFHLQLVQKEFLQELVKIVTNKANPIVVIDRVLNLLQTWSDAFQGVEELREVGRVVNELKEKGMEFPMTDLDLVSPIHTPARSTIPTASGQPVRSQQVETRSAPTSEESNGNSSGEFPEHVAYESLNYDVPPAEPEVEAGVLLSDEQKAKLRSDLDIVTRNCTVMGEMLTELTPGQETADDWQLLQGLNRTCRSMQQRVVSLIGQVQNEDVTNVLLHVNDEVNNVLLRYDRFERLRGGAQASQPVLSPAASSSSSGGLATATLIDVGGPSGGRIEQNSSSGTAGYAQSGQQNEPEFDMFAASRQSYEQNQQALHQSRQMYQADDQLTGGLGTAINLKSQSDPYEPGVNDENVKLDKEEDLKEMEEWTNANTLVAPSRQPQVSATSSEFDQFLAQRATSGEQTSANNSDQISAQKSNQSANRTIKKTDDDNSMFSL